MDYERLVKLIREETDAAYRREEEGSEDRMFSLGQLSVLEWLMMLIDEETPNKEST